MRTSVHGRTYESQIGHFPSPGTYEHITTHEQNIAIGDANKHTVADVFTIVQTPPEFFLCEPRALVSNLLSVALILL